ncbi:4287_t:CDS:1 [Ambispora gerdemannii]|uniref:4287_t:CDS:1 n=1 Tax=Ambispora gerdemannii TaxID=144530 RepID=A0A9N8YS92_9GLOM|nr:4287_t:CDS:1 [Ambispora gerdemannii]
MSDLKIIFEFNQPKKKNVAAEEPKNLNVEWPPHFDFETLFRNPKRKKSSPNAFILFRIKYLESLQQVGVNWPMPIVSRMAAAAWKRQTDDVKTKYESLACDANLHWAKWNPKPSRGSNVKKPGGQRRRSQQQTVNTVLNYPVSYSSPAYFVEVDTSNSQIFGAEMNSE